MKFGRGSGPRGTAGRAWHRLGAVALLLMLAGACLAAAGWATPAARRLAEAISPSAGAQAVPPPASPAKEYVYAGGRLVATEEPVNDAAFVSQTVPTSMVAGQLYNVRVLMKNTGTSTWTNAAGFKLGSQDPQDNMNWGVSRVVLPESYAPGAEAIFNISVRAPATPGSYKFQWRMVQDGVGWFGAHTTSVAVGVTAAPSSFLSGSFAVQTATVDLTAEGTQDWAHWGLSTESDFDHKAGVTSQISNYTVLGSGGAARFADLTYAHTWTDGTPTPASTATTGVFVSGAVGNGFRVTVPADATTRTLKLYVGAWYAQGQLHAQLSDGSAPTYIDASLVAASGASNYVYTLSYKAASAGQTLTLSYTLKANYNGSLGNITLQAASLMSGIPPALPAGDADFVWQSVPTSMTAGQPYAVSVTMRNTGSSSWTGTANSGFRLGSQNPQDNDTWGVSRVVLPASVMPGAEATFHFTIRAPETPDTYDFQWRMVCEGHGGAADGWLGDYTPNISITVTPSGSGGKLNGSLTAAPANGSVSLTTEGARDWMHWGLGGAASFDHKAGVTPQISNYAVIGNTAAAAFEDLAYTHTWTDGAPYSNGSVHTGVFVSGAVGNGFRVTVPADATTRTLKLYVGAWYAQGQLHAQLSDGSAPTYVDASLVAASGASNYVYTLSYKAASAGQTLTLSYTLKANYNGSLGNVTLQAAALSLDGPKNDTDPATAAPAPTGLLATATTSASVELTWTAPEGQVSRYVIERASSVGAFAPLPGNVTATSFVDTGVSLNNAYLYRVKAVFAGENSSDYSNVDLATTVIFSETLTPRVTTVKAQQLVELRLAVAAVRRLVPSLSPPVWTHPDPVSSPAEQRRQIYLEDVSDLRANLDAALLQLGRYEPYPAAPPLARGAFLGAEHFEQIRKRVR